MRKFLFILTCNILVVLFFALIIKVILFWKLHIAKREQNQTNKWVERRKKIQ